MRVLFRTDLYKCKDFVVSASNTYKRFASKFLQAQTLVDFCKRQLRKQVFASTNSCRFLHKCKSLVDFCKQHVLHKFCKCKDFVQSACIISHRFIQVQRVWVVFAPVNLILYLRLNDTSRYTY